LQTFPAGQGKATPHSQDQASEKSSFSKDEAAIVATKAIDKAIHSLNFFIVQALF